MSLKSKNRIGWRPLVLLFLSVLIHSCGDTGRDDQLLMFSYFKGNGEDGLHLAYSEDGLSWHTLFNDSSFLQPRVGKDKLMRDPCIISGPDGLFHMVWTVSWKEQGIGYAYSTDLINWSQQKYLPVMEHEPLAKNCWAPELFYDDVTAQYLIFWATTIPGRFPDTDNQSNNGPPSEGNNHRMYYATTRDFENFGETRIFYDHGFNVIDATIVKHNGQYVMFLKDETNKPFTPQKNIRIATAAAAAGPYSPPGPPISGPDWAEGPTVIKLQERWYLYFDRYRQQQFGLMMSEDLESWQDGSNRLDLPEGIRHGTVFPVKRRIVQNIIAAKHN